jgi:hypothetical protein
MKGSVKKMLTSIDNFFLGLNQGYKEYHQSFKSNKSLVLIRVILYIPSIILIFAFNLSLFFVDGARQLIVQPLLYNKRVIKDLTGDTTDQSTLNPIVLVLTNLTYSFFENVIMIVIYGINVAVFGLKGVFNLVFLIVSFTNTRLFKEL